MMEDRLVLVTGASGGTQGATGNRITRLLREKGLQVRAFVHRNDKGSSAFYLQYQSQRSSPGAYEAVGTNDSLSRNTSEEWLNETADREGGTNQEARDHLVSLWKQILLINQNQKFMDRMSQGHRLFQMMTGETPTPLHEWMQVNFAREA